MRIQDLANRNYSWVRNSKDANFEKNVSQNAFVSIVCALLQFVARFFIPPVILYYVSIDVYGLWAYCFIFINYFGMSMIGITNVYVRYTAIYLAKSDISKINRILSTGAVCASVMSLVAILCAWNFLPYTFPILQIPENLYHTAFMLIFGTIAIFSVELSVSTFKYLLHGLQKVGLQWMIHSLCYIIETFLIIAFLYNGFGILSLLYAYSIQILLSNALYAIACFYFVPNLSIRLKHFDPSMLKIFFHFGGIIQLRSILGIVNRSLTRLCAGMFLGTQAVALYDLGEKFPVKITLIPITGMFVFLPASSHLYAKGEKEKINSLYLYGSRFMSLTSGLMLGFLTPFSWALITFWLGPDPKYQTAALILACFAIPYHIHVVTGPASSAYRSINLPIKELIYGICELGSALIAVAAGFYFFGYSIMVINVTIGSMIFLSSAGYLFYTNHFLGVSQKEFFNKVIFPGFLPYVIASVMAIVCYQWSDTLLTSRWNAFYGLFSSWVIYTLCITPFYYYYILEEGERKHIREHYIQRLLNLFLPSKKEATPTKELSIGKTKIVWKTIHRN